MLEGKIKDSELKEFLRQEYRKGKITGLPGDWSEDEVVSFICKGYRSTAERWYRGYMKKGEQVVTHEEYKEMIDVFGRMTDAFKDLADQFEEENKTKKKKKARKAKSKYYSIFTKEEAALLSSAGQAKATGDKPEVHEPLNEAFVRAIPKESDKEKDWRERKEKERERVLRREYGDVRTDLLKRDRDLTLNSGTRSTEGRNRAEVGSSLRGNVTAANIKLQRESMGRIRRAVNREQEAINAELEKQSLITEAQVLGRKLANMPWTQIPAAEIERLKEFLGPQKLSRLIALNEKLYGPF
jgi:hypothetical protein